MKPNINKRVAGKLLEGDDAYATSVLALAISLYDGYELYKKDIDVVFDDLEQEYSCELSEENKNKLQAAITLLTTEAFYTRLSAFKAIVLAFNEGDLGGLPDDEDEEIEGSEIIWAVFEAGLMDNSNIDEMVGSFSESISSYISEVVSNEAEDLEEVPDDVDTIAEMLDTDYYMDCIKKNCILLAQQLSELGFDKTVLAQFLMENEINQPI